MYTVYCTDGPMTGQTIYVSQESFDVIIHDTYIFNDLNVSPPDKVTYQVHKWNETFYKRVPKLRMINLLFGRQSYTASISEPQPPPEMGEWQLIKEADFIDNHHQWFAEKCYEYGLLTDNEIW